MTGPKRVAEKQLAANHIPAPPAVGASPVFCAPAIASERRNGRLRHCHREPCLG